MQQANHNCSHVCNTRRRKLQLPEQLLRHVRHSKSFRLHLQSVSWTTRHANPPVSSRMPSLQSNVTTMLCLLMVRRQSGSHCLCLTILNTLPPDKVIKDSDAAKSPTAPAAFPKASTLGRHLLRHGWADSLCSREYAWRFQAREGRSDPGIQQANPAFAHRVPLLGAQLKPLN